jgi:hypothetical protein
MSRSHKKIPITGFTTERSEKAFKQQESRRQRAGIRSGQKFIPTSYGPKDGRQWPGKRYSKALRK